MRLSFGVVLGPWGWEGGWPRAPGGGPGSCEGKHLRLSTVREEGEWSMTLKHARVPLSEVA